MRIGQPPALEPATLRAFLYGYLTRLIAQLNAHSESAIAGATNARESPPTTGTYSVGDFIRNSAPAEITPPGRTYDAFGTGAGGSYVVFGWVCTEAGTPGTWREFRFYWRLGG